ncbi:Fic family protein, partial [Acidithiobacillus ferrooxidans]|nr:Fic family protein [Acidithiobacillus ferrooxidans]
GAVNTARRLVDLFQQDSHRVRAVGRGAANFLRVLEALRQRPLNDLGQISRQAGISFPTASKAMMALVEIGIARELTGRRRNRVFVYDAYMNILNEGGEAL